MPNTPAIAESPPVKWPPPPNPWERCDALTTRILGLLFEFRRLSCSDDPCAAAPCEGCFDIHGNKIQGYVRNGQPIELIILAFPAKSPNPTKVLGVLPDLAERLALSFLQSICDQIGTFYPPGARITICSDGHVFGDLVGVSDPTVSAYDTEIRKLIDELGGSRLRIYNLEDALGRFDYHAMRCVLERSYGVPLADLRRAVHEDMAWRTLFNGIHRFLFEDELATRTGQSRSHLRKACKALAYRVLQRSNAWSALVAERFPDAVRLSVHPQACHSEKLGIHLMPTRDSWLTPWHGAALDVGGAFRLVKRKEAEELNALLVWRQGRPSHYVLTRGPERKTA